MRIVGDNILNSTNSLAVIQINLSLIRLLSRHVNKQDVLLRCDDKLGLIIVEYSKVRLHLKRIIDAVTHFSIVSEVVITEDIVAREEEQFVLVGLIECKLSARGRVEAEGTRPLVLELAPVVSPVYHNFLYLLLLAHSKPADRDAQLVFTWRRANPKDLLRLTSALFVKLGKHAHLLSLCIRFGLVNAEGVLVGQNVLASSSQVGSDGALKVLLCKRHLEVVRMFPRVDHEVRLVKLIADAKTILRINYHCRAVHKVVHDVLEGRLIRLQVDAIEVNFIVSRHLEAIFATRIEDFSAYILELSVLLPSSLLVHCKE